VNEIRRRKEAHLDLCAQADVEARRSTLLGEVHLLHEALPDASWDEIDPSVELLGRRLQAPLLIASMTGGTERAGELNRALASAA
jgi:isopentenyl-diphosphate Delta-isomerase